MKSNLQAKNFDSGLLENSLKLYVGGLLFISDSVIKLIKLLKLTHSKRFQGSNFQETGTNCLTHRNEGMVRIISFLGIG